MFRFGGPVAARCIAVELSNVARASTPAAPAVMPTLAALLAAGTNRAQTDLSTRNLTLIPKLRTWDRFRLSQVCSNGESPGVGSLADVLPSRHEFANTSARMKTPAGLCARASPESWESSFL